MYSCDFVQRSFTLSGIGLGLCQMMSCLKYQPLARSANANSHGMPIKSLDFNPAGTGVGGLLAKYADPLFDACMPFNSVR